MNGEITKSTKKEIQKNYKKKDHKKEDVAFLSTKNKSVI